MSDWSIRVEPRGDTYRALIRAANVRGATGGLVVQNFSSWSASLMPFIEQLTRYTLSIQQTTEWPGTIQGPRKAGPTSEGARLYRFPLSDEVVHLLTSHASGLYDWSYPDLPEDLCFFDANGRIWLTTISHERDAYLTLSRPELADLISSVPGLIGEWDLAEEEEHDVEIGEIGEARDGRDLPEEPT